LKISRIHIKNLFGISERALDGKSVELSGPIIATRVTDSDELEVAEIE
jgi:hypothetical protein